MNNLSIIQLIIRPPFKTAFSVYLIKHLSNEKVVDIFSQTAAQLTFLVMRLHTVGAGDCNLISLHPSNRVFTEGTCKLLKLVISDLVDEDFVVNRRQQAASALLFGMVALLTKPGQTFAPLIGTWLLCVYTGMDREVHTGFS